MLDALKEDLPNECKARLRKAELKAEDRLRTEIRRHFRKLTPEALEASQPGDHKKLIPFIEQYSESVVRAWAQEVIPLFGKEGQYLEKVEAVAKALVDEMTPEKRKLIWSYDNGLDPTPSGYWEETLLHCWHVLEGKGQVTDTWSVRDAFDSNYRWTLRLRNNTKPFRRHLLTHLLKEQMSSWKGMWWEHRAQKQSEADSGPSPDQDSSENEQAVGNKKPGRPPYSEDLKLQALAALNEGKSMREATKILRKLKRSPTRSEVASTHGSLGYYLNNHPGTWTPSYKAREKYPELCKRAEQLKKA